MKGSCTAATWAFAFLVSSSGTADDGGHRRFDRFLLPAFESDPSVTCTVHLEDGKPPERDHGKTDVDGHPTDAPWPEVAPQAFRLTTDRWVLFDPYYGHHRLSLWDRATKRLWSLGSSLLIPVGGWGRIPIVYDLKANVVRICDFDPKLPALRTIWSGRLADVTIAGHSGGSILAIVRRDTADTTALTLAFGRKPQETRVNLRGFAPASSDSVRGHMMILVGAPLGNPIKPGHSPERGVALLDLRNDRFESIGHVRGVCFIAMNCAHEGDCGHYRFPVAWIPKRPEPILPRDKVLLGTPGR